MKWTTDKPTQPGYYWFRQHQHLSKDIFEVVLSRKNQLQIVDDDLNHSLDNFNGGEWAGPIPEPD